MILESGLILVIVQLAGADENCTENCLVCNNGTCSSCVPGYYGDDCDTVCSHCKDWKCEERICPFGCENGWYALACDKRCDERCLFGRCEQFGGQCYDSTSRNCFVGVCTRDCQQYCESDFTGEDGDVGGNAEYDGNEDNLSSIALLVFIVLAAIAIAAACGICAYKSTENSQNPKVKVSRVEVIPPKQKLLPGYQPDLCTSSNMTFVHAQFSDAILDSDNVLIYSNTASPEMLSRPNDGELVRTKPLPSNEMLYEDSTNEVSHQLEKPEILLTDEESDQSRPLLSYQSRYDDSAGQPSSHPGEYVSIPLDPPDKELDPPSLPPADESVLNEATKQNSIL